MARRVYFSFHYKDVWRANQVRNSWVTKRDRESAGFFDSAEFEAVKKQGDAAIKRWIDRNLEGTSVTVVIIGQDTCNRRWVRYEIQKSMERGNGIIGVYAHNLGDQNGATCQQGELDFGKVDGEHDFSDLYPVYDWVNDDGYNNIGDWIDTSALAAGRPELGPPPYRYGSITACRRK